MSDKNPSSSVGRDELAALLGASRASDLVAVANNDANKSAIGAGLAPQSRRHNRKDDAEDVSKMDRSQAAALVAKQFGSGTQSAAAGGGVARHRASGKRKRQYQLLAGDLTDRSIIAKNDVISSMAVEEGINIFYDKEGIEKEEEDTFDINKSNSGGGKRKKLQAKVLLKRGGDASSNASSSSSSSHSSSSSDDESRKRSSRRNRKPRSNSSSSSSSSDEDEADLRRKRAREKAQTNQRETAVVSVRGSTKVENTNDSSHSRGKLDAPPKSEVIDKIENVIDVPVQEHVDDKRIGNTKHQKRDGAFSKRKKQNNAFSSGSESSSSDDNVDSSTSSSSSSSSSEDDDIAPMSVSKPLFVPKSKRGTLAEVEAQQQKLEEAEERRIQEKEKRAVQSRALVAETVSAVGKNVSSSHGIGDGDEFDTGEVGGEFIPVPDDSDPADDSPELVLAERDAWEVRELLRILRDVDEAVELEKERKELERRRALTDEERLEEDRRSGRYRAPGEARRVRKDDERRDGSKGENNYLQRYHHRGAFYLDEDTLNQAGENDVRHRALEYSRAVTGGDRVDKRSLPEVMQVKNFGLAGYSTKYKGLAKEDTTDKRQDFLPIRSVNAGTRDEKSNNSRYNHSH